MTQSNSPGGGAGADPGSGRDPRLDGFAEDGQYATALPLAAVAAVLEDLADGTGRPPPEATDDEIIGMLSCWQGLEAHANARLLAVLRELIRRRAKAGFGDYPGDLPGSWDTGTAHEAAAELGISWQAAAPMLHLAWEVEARLPGIGRLLDQGVLSGLKIRIIVDEFLVLDDEKASEAEKLLLDYDLGAASMTPARLRKLCQQLSDTVDPDGARERRESLQRENARVAFYRAHGGSTAMFAEGLPADGALMAEKSIQARALAYRAAGIYPDQRMDCLRVLAMLDLINQVTLDDRTARYHAGQGDGQGQDQGQGYDQDADPGADPPGRDQASPDDRPGPQDDSSGILGADGPNGNGSASPGRDRDRPGESSPGGNGRGTREPGLPSLVNLTLPLATLLGLAERPGEVPGFGSVDAGLVRDLARAAAASPRTELCFTITDNDGHAAGHACARLIRGTQGRDRAAGNAARRTAGRPGGTGQPGRAGSAPGGWDLQPDPARSGPDDGYGSWILTIPGGARYRLDIHPVPLHDCDHRYATDAYRPGKLLRHLVEVRDGECVSVSCSHPARMSDFEHAVPWQRGGASDACNAGPVSRACHQVKQSPGWSLSNPEPGTHRWRTPSGRTYEKGPKSYPA